jgi:hypothetical protein
MDCRAWPRDRAQRHQSGHRPAGKVQLNRSRRLRRAVYRQAQRAVMVRTVWRVEMRSLNHPAHQHERHGQHAEHKSPGTPQSGERGAHIHYL